jgi:hypothetical protein
VNSDEQAFDDIITHIKAEPTEETNTQFQSIISQLLDRRGAKTYKQLTKIINLSLTYGIQSTDIDRLLLAMDDLKDAYNLFTTVVDLALKDEGNYHKLIGYLVEKIGSELDKQEFNIRNLMKIIRSLDGSKINAELQEKISDVLIKVIEEKCSFGGYEG